MFNEFFLERTTRANLITTQIGSDVCRAEIKWSRKLKSFQSTYDRKKKRRPAFPNTRSQSYSLYRTCVCVLLPLLQLWLAEMSRICWQSPVRANLVNWFLGFFFHFFGLSGHYCIGLWLYGANIRTQADRVRCHASGPKTKRRRLLRRTFPALLISSSSAVCWLAYQRCLSGRLNRLPCDLSVSVEYDFNYSFCPTT